jgi:hypothetical protein
MSGSRGQSVLHHLLRHDVLTHRRLLIAWVGTVLAHPLAGWLSWTTVGTGNAIERNAWVRGDVPILAVLLVALRLVLMVVTIGLIVQGDSPVDDRAFWRTRPIEAGRLARAKLLLCGLVFVAFPTLVVCGVAAAVGVPWAHWPSMLWQVIATDTALAGTVFVLATRTRHVTNLLLAVACCVGVLYLIISALQSLRHVAWLHDRNVLADPAIATGVTFAWVSLAAGVLGVVAYRGTAWRNRFAMGVLATVLLIVASWFVPALRAARPQQEPVSVEATGAPIRAERLRTADGLVGIVVEPIVSGLKDTDRAQLFLLDGMLSGPWGTRAARPGVGPRSVFADDTRPAAPLLAVLDERAFAALAGRPATFRGRFNVQVERTQIVATAPLAAGVTFTTPHTKLRLKRLVADSEGRGRESVADGVMLWLHVPATWTPGYTYRLRAADDGCEATALPFGWRGSSFMDIALLPTLARPFYVHRVTLSAMGTTCVPRGPGTTIELLSTIHYATPVAVPITATFRVPGAAEPARTVVRYR